MIAFHGRDTESVAEAVGAARLRKALLLGGIAVELDVRFDSAGASCLASADAALPNTAVTQLEGALQNILGLRLDPLPFIALTQDDPLMGRWSGRRPDCASSSRPRRSKR